MKYNKLTLKRTYMYKNEYGETIVERKNVFSYIFEKCFKGTKTKVVNGRQVLYDSYLRILLRHLYDARLWAVISTIIAAISLYFSLR